MKFLLYEIIPRAGFNLVTGRFWPAGRMFDTPGVIDLAETGQQTIPFFARFQLNQLWDGKGNSDSGVFPI